MTRFARCVRCLVSPRITAGVGITCFWLVLLARVVVVQTATEELRAAANSQRTSLQKVAASTGRILDRRGRALALTVLQPSIFADPSRIESPASFAKITAAILERDEAELADELTENSHLKFRWLKRRVDPQTVSALRAADLPNGSWGIRDEPRRLYPQGAAAAHLLGLRGLDGKASGGIEEQFASLMTGQYGTRRLVKDARGEPLSLLDEFSSAPIPGRDVRLTIDGRLSTLVGQHLDHVMTSRDPSWAVAIVIDPRNGHLLAVESRPTYDPNSPTAIAAAGFNYALHATFEPGSTVKPLIVAEALDRGTIQTDSIIDCGPGRDRVGGRPMRDASALGLQPLANVLAKSSNIGSARVAQTLSEEGLFQGLRKFGLGEPVPLEINCPEAGTLRPPSEWSGYSLGSLAMGHEMAVTPLQLITAYASLTQSRRITPQLVIDDPGLVERGPGILGRGVADWITGTALKLAVDSGTAKSVRIDGVDVFGKTGTAQKFDADLGRYRTDRATCVVVAGAPVLSPTRVVLVVVADPTIGPPFSGGRVAGPVARAVLDDAMAFAESNDDRKPTTTSRP